MATGIPTHAVYAAGSGGDARDHRGESSMISHNTTSGVTVTAIPGVDKLFATM